MSLDDHQQEWPKSSLDRGALYLMPSGETYRCMGARLQYAESEEGDLVCSWVVSTLEGSMQWSRTLPPEAVLIWQPVNTAERVQGSLWRDPDGSVYRYIRTDESFDPLDGVTRTTSEVFMRLSRHGAALGVPLPDDAVLIWSPQQDLP